MAQSFRFSRMTHLAAMFFLAIPFATACDPAGVDGGGGAGGENLTVPTVLSNSPLMAATNVAINDYVTVTFSEEMDSAKLNAMTFSLKSDAGVVPGKVTYANSTATFWPATHLVSDTQFTATVTTGAVSAAGVPLAASHTWTFTTGKTIEFGHVVPVGTEGTYAILAKTGISSSPASTITGDIAVSPAAASYITGFALVADATNVFATSVQVNGKVFASDYAPPTPSILTTAVSDMELAFTAAASRSPDVTELGAGNIGGMLLSAGVYKWGTGVLIPTDLTLSGTAKDVWIFQIGKDLELADAVKVNLTGGALPKNVFWQVAGLVKLGTTSHIEGIVLSQTSITVNTGASVIGRLFAQTAVSLSGNTVVQPSM